MFARYYLGSVSLQMRAVVLTDWASGGFESNVKTVRTIMRQDLAHDYVSILLFFLPKLRSHSGFTAAEHHV